MSAMKYSALFLLLVICPLAGAKVSSLEAARLKSDLTPLGAERAGNAAGTIPAWDGGLTQAPADYKGKGTRLVDPFPGDQPLFVITKDNYRQYREQLSVGHRALFEKYADYKMPVFRSRRTGAAPQFVYDATLRNATAAELGADGESLAKAVTGIPFPIPKSAKEIIWNHKTRYRGRSVLRYSDQAAVTRAGDFVISTLREEVRFNYNYPDITPASLDNVAIYFLQTTMAPARIAGGMLLVHETLNQVKEARRIWLYSSGQRRLRRAPEYAYDNPGTASDGLRTADQLDMFNGAGDRYSWKLLGKRELYIPYNAFRAHSDKVRYRDLCKPGHINQDHTRYELHRVWVVEAENVPAVRHIYKKRVFYIDEDTWTIALADMYDQRGDYWRFQEGHSLPIYDVPATAIMLEVSYDLTSGRYLAFSMNNERPEYLEKEYPVEYFGPGNVIKFARK